VSSTWRAQLAVSERLLRHQLGYIQSKGYVGLTLTDAERLRTGGTLPERSVVVTFDDGYASTMKALPVLEELGFPGTVFVPTRFIESAEPLRWTGVDQWLRGDTSVELHPLTWTELERLRVAGWEVGSHTVTHALLTAVEDEQLRVELCESRATIERRLGDCTSVSYPYGRADRRVAAAARDAGYVVGCTLTFSHAVDEPFLRPRIGIGPADQGVRLRAQVSRAGQAARRSLAARMVHRLPRRRTWLPAQ
jgi:peptidoglycan/xylan/chitin deacetylase (PgdA/CDA1 family)